MKKLLKVLWALPLTALLAVGCQSEDVVYNGGDYVMFSDSVYTMPVLEDDKVFEVPVSATNATDYDRNYAVEIINEKSTAIRGYHFDFVDGTNNITIKAGERVGIVKLKPTYANVAREDSLVISLRLLEPKDEELDLYGNVTRVDMQKCYPFSMDNFMYPGAYTYMLASFPFGDQLQQIRVDAEVVDDHTIKLKNAFSDLYPIRLIFNDSDPLNYVINVPEQEAFKDSNYGTIYLRSVEMYPSYFNVPDRFFILYLEMYIPQVGSFGVYQYIFKCITKEEAWEMDNGEINTGGSILSLRALSEN